MAEIQPLPELQTSAVTSLRSYAAGDTDSTARLHEVASAFVSAREHFYTKEGDPDRRGTTAAYRRWVREVFSLANIPQGDVATIQAAIRYHAGNVLRDRFDADTINALGLQSAGPRERSVHRRTVYSETLALFGAGGAAIETPDEIVSMADTIAATLARVPLSSVAKLPARDRRRVAAAVERVCELASALAETAGVTK